MVAGIAPGVEHVFLGTNMTIVQQLKTESLRLRKERSPIAASITFVLSEIERVGKNNGNRATTEDEAVKVVQKVIATLRDNLKYDISDSDAEAMRMQIQILESVLPAMASDDEILNVLRAIMTGKTAETSPKKGEIMKTVRDKFGAAVDMKRVSQLLLDVYGV